MNEANSELKQLVQSCKYPLKINFSFDWQQQVFCLAIGYENAFPVIAKYEKLPDNLSEAVSNLLLEFDIEAKNKQLAKQSLKDDGKRKVKPVEKSVRSTSKKKKVKFARSLI